MSGEKTVKVFIKNDGSGKTKFELNGFVGNECDSIAQLEAQMGTVVKTEATAEAALYENPDHAHNELYNG